MYVAGLFFILSSKELVARLQPQSFKMLRNLFLQPTQKYPILSQS